METARFGVALGAAVALLLQPLLPPRSWAAQEPITETLLQQSQRVPAAGRLWPGFAAAQGLDTGATADPNGPKPEQVDTGATAEPTGAPPEPLLTDLSPGGIPSGGDLSAPTVPWMGTGTPAPATPPTPSLTGGVPTSGGTSLGGDSPLGSTTSLPNYGNLAAGMLGSTMPGMPGMGGMGALAGLGMLSQSPGMEGLGNIMSLVGMLSILNSLPQMIAQLSPFITQLPQMLVQIIQSIGQMFLSIFQLPQALWEALSGVGQGLMGLGGQLGQASSSPPAAQAPPAPPTPPTPSFPEAVAMSEDTPPPPPDDPPPPVADSSQPATEPPAASASSGSASVSASQDPFAAGTTMTGSGTTGVPSFDPPRRMNTGEWDAFIQGVRDVVLNQTGNNVLYRGGNTQTFVENFNKVISAGNALRPMGYGPIPLYEPMLSPEGKTLPGIQVKPVQ